MKGIQPFQIFPLKKNNALTKYKKDGFCVHAEVGCNPKRCSFSFSFSLNFCNLIVTYVSLKYFLMFFFSLNYVMFTSQNKYVTVTVTFIYFFYFVKEESHKTSFQKKKKKPITLRKFVNYTSFPFFFFYFIIKRLYNSYKIYTC